MDIYKFTASIFLPFSLSACVGLVFDMEVDQPGKSPASASVLRDVPFIVRIAGRGRCDSIDINFGDGKTSRVMGTVFNGGTVDFFHTYTGWPGEKTISVTGSGFNECHGTVTENVRVVNWFDPTPHFWYSSWVRFDIPTLPENTPNPSVGRLICGPLGGYSPLREGTLVQINELVNSDGKRDQINFGCASGGCVYGAAGQPGSSADLGYPFPGVAKYSLVARVGSQIFHIGENRTFKVAPSTELPAPLELCMNDDSPKDNNGRWSLEVWVDEK